MTHEDHMPPICGRCGDAEASRYIDVGHDTLCDTCAALFMDERADIANSLSKAIFGEIR